MKRAAAHLLGRAAEQRAARFLQHQGYTIRAQNHRFGKAEVDLIAAKADLLLFVEVKMRTQLAFGYPETFLTPAQAARYHDAATDYVEQTAWPGQIRFDILALTKQGQEWDIMHFEDAF